MIKRYAVFINFVVVVIVFFFCGVADFYVFQCEFAVVFLPLPLRPPLKCPVSHQLAAPEFQKMS